ncbi:MAG: T9SS type A sorting domain-containing protein [Crocinitomicaceae bacterium]
MKNFFTLASILLVGGFTSFGQTEVQLTEVSNSDVRAEGVLPTVIQSVGIFDRQSIIDQSEQLSGSLDITDPEMGDGLVVSPNPTKGNLSVSVPADLIGREIRIIDMTGRFVGNPIPIVGTTEKLTITGESGMYLLVIQAEERVITERIQLDTH